MPNKKINSANCDLLDNGHKVFWLKVIKLIGEPRQESEIEVLDETKIEVRISGKAQIFFNHDTSKVLEAKAERGTENWTVNLENGLLFLSSGSNSEKVFSLSGSPLGPCEHDPNILREVPKEFRQ